MKRLIVGLAVAGAFAGGLWAQGVGDKTYASCKAALDEISTRVNANQSRLDNGYAQIAAAAADLAAMEAAYTDFIGTIAAESAADPNDAAWLVADAEADLLTAEWTALKATADAQKAALDAL
jgi:hypothetical protein